MGRVGFVAKHLTGRKVDGEDLAGDLDGGVGRVPYGKEIAERILTIRIRTLDVDDPRAVVGVQGFEARPSNRKPMINLGISDANGRGDLHRPALNHDPEVRMDMYGQRFMRQAGEGKLGTGGRSVRQNPGRENPCQRYCAGDPVSPADPGPPPDLLLVPPAL